MKTTAMLRKLLKEKKTLLIPGCYDAYSARIVEKVGFEAAYLSGFALESTLLGMPDVNLTTMTEISGVASHITDVIKIPLIADGETGFGGPLQVRRTVREYEKAGLAGFHIEDQVYPKKGGSIAGRTIIPVDEMIGKIQAALEARQDKDFLIIARTDAIDVSFKEAVNRTNAYVEAGADLVMVIPSSAEEVKRFPKEVNGPLLVCMSDHRPYMVIPFTEYENLGYKIVMFILSELYVVGKALFELWEHVMKTGTTKALIEGGKMLTINELADLLRLPEIRDFETKYLPKREIELRYGKKQWGV